MAVRILEADSDYVNVGNIMLPLDASEYGYDSYDTITRKTQKKYDDEKEAERQEAERQAKEKERKEFIASHREQLSQILSIIHDDTIDASQKIEDLFELTVPDSGKADTIGGELVRAVNRLGYRYMNDGDYYFEGYGLETCGSDAAYIAETSDDVIYNQIVNFAEDMCGRQLDDSQINQEYQVFLNELYYNVINYFDENVDALFAISNTVDSRTYKSDLVREWDELSHNWEYDASDVFYSLPREWDLLSEAGLVSENDVADLCDELTFAGFPGTVEHPFADAIIITNLDREGYEQWQNEFWREFDSWLEDLITEHQEFLDSAEDEDYDEENKEDEE